MKKREKVEVGNFASGSIYRHIIRLAIPLTIAQLVHMLYSIVDRIYIGHLPLNSSDALTGLGLTFPIVSIISAFTSLYSLGGAPLSSIERGRGDNDEAEKIMGNSFSLMIITSVFLYIFFSLTKKPILYLFGASDSTYIPASLYLKIYLLGTPFVMIGTGMNQFITSQGFGKTGMATITLGAILNIILDPILIFIFHMGISGAAIASVLSQFLSALIVVLFLTGKTTILKINKSSMILEKRRVRRIMSLGFAGFIMKATNGVVQAAANSTLQIFGGDLFVGLMTVFNSLRDMIALPASGLTDAGKPIIGYNYGAARYRRIKKAIFFMTIVAVCYMTVAWLTLLYFPTFFISIFSAEEGFLTVGPYYLRLYFSVFFFMLFQFVGQAVFVGLGKARRASFFSLFRKIILVVPLTLILPRLGLGVMGVFIAEPISDVIGGGMCYITMIFTVRKLISGKAKEEQSPQSQP